VLDHVHLRHSTRFPTLCTLTVDGNIQNSPVSSHSPTGDQAQWLLASADPRHERTRLFRLHTLDIYFWTLEDANLFLDSVERVLAPSQVETDRQQHQTSEAVVSKVVQNLENVAITDPAYQNGQTRDSRSDSVSAAQLTPQSASIQATNPGSFEASKQGQAPNYAPPMAYNPAAPAAPEPIRHREKTPPPADGAGGTGLAAAVAADQGHYYTPSQATGGFAPRIGQTGYAVPGPSQLSYSSPPPSAGLVPGVSAHGYAAVPSFAAPPTSSSVSVQSGTMSFAPPPQDPNAHLYAQQPYRTAQASYDPQYTSYLQSQSHGEEDHTAPIGGYSDYSYTQPVRHHSASGSEYDIHSQAYRPTEAEAKSHSMKHAKHAMKNPNSRPHKLEEKAASIDSKINGFLKRIEKKIG
jgi:hypothetical protein